MTDTEFNRLPPVLQEIVQIDRRLEREREAEVPDFETILALRKRRRELHAFCSGGWGRPADPDNQPPLTAAGAAA